MYRSSRTLPKNSIEFLEARIALATFLVTTTADSGAGSFRQAILDANSLVGPDTIQFDLPGSVVFKPTSALPQIRDTVTILGDANPVVGLVPRFILSGADAGNASGLSFFGSAAAGSQVRGLTISEFKSNGIHIADTRDIEIVNCHIGESSNYIGNAGAGIWIMGSTDIAIGRDGTVSSLTTPGSKTWGSSNVIVGNTGAGIQIIGGIGHEIHGNLIGLTTSGIASSNADGISVQSATVTVGGAGLGDGNVISGNRLRGIYVTSCVGTLIQGNHIGTDIAGIKTVANGNIGVLISGGTRDTIIGGTQPGEGNLISGNGASGINISGSNAGVPSNSGQTKIQGNLIGTDITGTKALPNKNHGISIQLKSSILIGGSETGAKNVISANGTSPSSSRGYGIRLERSEFITIQQNFIGTDITGNLDLGNVVDGIGVLGGKQIQIGGGSVSERNVISGNGAYGISFGIPRGDIIISPTIGSTIENNYIGTNSQGIAAVGNELGGVYLGKLSESISVSGGKGNWRNVISGNGGPGISVSGNAFDITGNYIGLNASGTFPVGNVGEGIEMRENWGDGSIDSNTISGNSHGIVIKGKSLGKIGLGVTKNIIGLDPTGTRALGNLGNGILIKSGSATISLNTISGNGEDGIHNSSGEIRVIENRIGTNFAGTGAIPNLDHGIHQTGTPLSALFQGNLVSGNLGDGFYMSGRATLIQNLIGTDATGKLALGNAGAGIRLNGWTAIAIGSDDFKDANIICANGAGGIIGSELGSLVISNNQVGLGKDANYPALGNLGDGVSLSGDQLSFRASGNIIGANAGHGFSLHLGKSAGAMRIQGNSIGFVSTIEGTIARGNAGDGIHIEGSGMLNSEVLHVLNNRISANDGAAVHVNEVQFESGDLSPGRKQPRGLIAGNLIGGIVDPKNPDLAKVGGGIALIETRFLHVGTFGWGNVIAGLGPLGSGYHLAIEIDGGISNKISGNQIGAKDLPVGFVLVQGGSHHVIGQGTNDPTQLEDSNANTLLGSGILAIGVDQITITHNSIAHSQFGIVVADADQSLIAENHISDFQDAGIWIRGSNVVPPGNIRDNEIRAGNGVGIRIESGNFEISRNLIYGNSGVAIDLGADGITPNDPADLDVGPNGLQNTITVRSAVLRGDHVIVRGAFDGAANRALRVEYFAILLDETGAEIGAHFLAESVIETDGAGHANIHETFPPTSGHSRIVATVTDLTDHVTSETAVSDLIVAPTVIAVGTGAGTNGVAKLVRASALDEVIVEVKPYGETFRGGIRVAHADIDGDGFDDLITAPDSGGRVVRVFSGFDGSVLSEWEAAPRGYRGGISVAAGDVDGDGSVEIVTALGFGRIPTVTVRDAMTGTVESSFSAFGKSYRSGLNLSVGDLDHDGDDDIVASLRSGVAMVKAFTSTGESLSPLIRPFAGQASIGAFTAIIPATPHSDAQIAVGSGVGARGAVQFFDVSGSRLSQLPVFDGHRFAGLRLASADVDGDGVAEIVATLGPGHRSNAEVIPFGSAPDGLLFDPSLRTGVFIG